MGKISTSNESLLCITPITKGQKTIKSTSAITIEKLDNLVSLDGHPFNFYKGQQFLDFIPTKILVQLEHPFDQSSQTTNVPKNLSYITHIVVSNESRELIAQK